MDRRSTAFAVVLTTAFLASLFGEHLRVGLAKTTSDRLISAAPVDTPPAIPSHTDPGLISDASADAENADKGQDQFSHGISARPKLEGIPLAHFFEVEHFNKRLLLIACQHSRAPPKA